MTQKTYKEAFVDAVTDTIAEDIADRSERILAVHALTDAYIDSVGVRPDAEQLERLTDYILREELTDRHPDKVTRTEYPFMSEWQLELRRDKEYSDVLAENHGIDGRNYNTPIRRHRTAREHRFVDKVAQTKNRQRSAQYRKDTAAGPLVTYNLRDTGGELAPDFVQCRSHGVNVIPEYYRI